MSTSSRPLPSQAPDPSTAPDLTVVIVNYESGEFLRSCLGELPRAVEPSKTAVLVIDNASSDGSLRGVGDLAEIVRNPENVGFARACNQSLALTTSPYLLFLNPDCLPEPASVSRLLEAARQRPRAGAVGPRILNPDRTLQLSCRIVPPLRIAVGHAVLGWAWPSNPFTRQYMLLDWDHHSERKVDWISGSAMLVRRDAFEGVGGFDERFFMYVEDLDLCERMRKDGWEVVYFPGAEMVHHVAGSTRRTPYRMIAHHHLSAFRYWWSKSNRSPRVILAPVVAAGLAGRLLLTWLDQFQRSRRRAAVVSGP